MRLAKNTGRKKNRQKFAIWAPSQLCRAISSQVRRVSTIGKNLLNSNLLHVSLQYMVYQYFAPLRAEIGLPVRGTPANFNEFRVILASLLHRRRSMEVNQTLHDLWPSPGLVHSPYIHFGGSCPLTEFCQLQNSL